MKAQKRRTNRSHILKFDIGGSIRNYVFLADPIHPKRKIATPLGEGGSGVVYLVGQVLHQNFQIKRALKFFLYRPNVADRLKINETLPVSKREFITEIANFSQLNHEGLIRIIDAGFHSLPNNKDLPFVITDFVDGPTLEHVLKASDDINDRSQTAILKRNLKKQPEQVLSLLTQIARALKYMHDLDFFHCDIAPKNIFLKHTDINRPIIGDLGLGYCLNRPRATNRVAGTRAYMPPHVSALYGKHLPWSKYVALQPRWDLFSLAKTGLELSDLIPDLNKYRWRRPLIECLRACSEGTKYPSIDSLIDQLDWLSYRDRVPELARGLSGQQKKIIPVDSLILSARVRKLTSHPALLRLATIPQLTLAKLVFPGAVHTRYEHALGAMETMRRYLLALVDSPDFLTRLNSTIIETALIAALLANLTRHPLHNITGEIQGVIPEYEELFKRSEMFEQLFRRTYNSAGHSLEVIIKTEFPNVDQSILRNIILGSSVETQSAEEKLIFSMLNCSLDVRVADFIRRDSIHLGVAGFTFDLEDLLGQLTVYDGRLALSVSGIGIAEQLIAMRYWLFNRVYWNTPNRCFVGMVRFCLSRLGTHRTFIKELRKCVLWATEPELLQLCLRAAKRAKDRQSTDILKMLCHPEQPVYKSILQVSPKENSQLSTAWRKVAEMDFHQMVQLANRIENSISKTHPELKSSSARRAIIVDMPPDEKVAGNKLGQDINVVKPQGPTMSLVEASEIVSGINNAFSTHLRRLRVYCHPELLAGRDKRYLQSVSDAAEKALHDMV